MNWCMFVSNVSVVCMYRCLMFMLYKVLITNCHCHISYTSCLGLFNVHLVAFLTNLRSLSLFDLFHLYVALQCFDSVGWAPGTASGL